MSNIKATEFFDIIETADGSPSLSLSGGEMMHSSDGALAETVYIYAPTIKKALDFEKTHILSLGLGLGYNEILSIALSTTYQKEYCKIISYELVDELKTHFSNWALEQKETPLDSCYNKICSMISEEFNLNPVALKENVGTSLKDNSIEIKGPLEKDNTTGIKFNAILYDAFSNHTDAYLWDQEYLAHFIDSYCDKFCVFSTYAATGNLKRALKEKNFSLEKKKGFSRKRESIFASR